jgi:hypothetical protein
MSFNKYVSRGFTGSAGSGEGRWVQSSGSSPGSQGSTSRVANPPSGTSFVMGGGGLRGKPTASTHSSERDSGYCDNRYSFNAHDLRQNERSRHSQDPRDGAHAASLNEWMSTKRGHQIVVGIAMYGIALFILIFLLISLFGSGKGEGFYTAPAGISRHARPMWER